MLRLLTREKKIPHGKHHFVSVRSFFEAFLLARDAGLRISHTNFSLDPHRYLHEVMLPVHTAFSSHNTFCVRFSLIQILKKQLEITRTLVVPSTCKQPEYV